MNSGTGIYKSGVLAFFAGAILIGALLGAVTFCFMGSDELSMLSVLSNSRNSRRRFKHKKLNSIKPYRLSQTAMLSFRKNNAQQDI